MNWIRRIGTALRFCLEVAARFAITQVLGDAAGRCFADLCQMARMSDAEIDAALQAEKSKKENHAAMAQEPPPTATDSARPVEPGPGAVFLGGPQ